MSNNIEFEHLNFAASNILVVGDVMLDQYWHGTASRISPEAPVPVVKINKTDNRVGGAANVANNLHGLGCKVGLLGISGQDAAADLLEEALAAAGVTNKVTRFESFVTIVKLRILNGHQQMIRLDREQDSLVLSDAELRQVYDLYADGLGQYQAVVLSDYAKGLLRDPQPYIKAARAFNIPVIVDPKGTDFSRYRGAFLIKPNLQEFQAIVGKCDDLAVLEERARELLLQHDIQHILITRGSQGMSLVSIGQPIVHLPAFGGEVYDVTGAGDTVIAVLTGCLAAGMDLVAAVHVSSVAAGIVVGKVGTSQISAQEIVQALGKDKPLPVGVMDAQSLRGVLKLCQARGEKIVFVNGCYDILHYGHIRYLERARAFGDRLVVGINSDDSIKRLKGPQRPYYTLQQRMEVLAALKAVDWVVSFEEDTPGKLVEILSPDILVKGSENFASIEQIPATEGTEHVLANGGTIHLVDRTENCSSTKSLEFINTTKA